MSTSTREPPADAEGARRPVIQALTLEAGDAAIALPLARVAEVVRMPRLGALPGAPDGVLGCLDLRGDRLLVVDLFTRLGLPPAPIHPDQVLVIVHAGDTRVALRAARVDRVVECPLVPLPPTSDALPGALGLLEDAVPPVALLDPDHLLAAELLALADACAANPP